MWYRKWTGGRKDSGRKGGQTRDGGCLDHKNSNREKYDSKCLRLGN